MAEILVNPLRSLDWCAAAAVDAVESPRSFHRRLDGYEATPLVDVSTLASELGLSRLVVKDESSRFGLPAFKILGASWATYRCLAARLGSRAPLWRSAESFGAAVLERGPLTLVTATDGNHGRAVARMARLLGLAATILVPAGTASARIGGIASEGATVEVVDGSYDDAVRAAANRAADDVLVISDTSWPGYHEVPGWVIDGYETIFAEIDEQMAGARVDVVVVQMGVGALAAAAARHFRPARPTGDRNPPLAVVEPTTAACGLESARAGRPVEVPGPHRSIMAGLNCGTVSEVAWPSLAAGVDLFAAVEDHDTIEAMADLAAAGLVAGETGASGLAGLRALVASGSFELPEGACALVINTEGATDPDAYRRLTGHEPGATA